MKLTVAVKLQPTPEQAAHLLATLEAANLAANQVSQQAWDAQVFGQFTLHTLCYASVRAASGLAAQVVVRLVAKVADAYKLDKQTQRTFRLHGSIAYDDRILRWLTLTGYVSIWTVGGRLYIPFRCGEKQRELLAFQQGESDLVYRNRAWYLYTTINFPETEQRPVDDYLGIDLGIVNIATDSDGTMHPGGDVDHHRRVYAHRRRNLQRRLTKSAKRKLVRLAGRQMRFQKLENHRISKQIVNQAEGTKRGIALEDLTHIRARTTVRKAKRARQANWSFAHLRSCIEYKARMAGVPVVLVDPRNTSKQCSRCGCTDRANRRTQADFLCILCGFALAADYNAALNLSFRARVAVNQPMVCASSDATDKSLRL